MKHPMTGAFVLGLVLALSAAACGSDDGSDDDRGSATGTPTATTTPADGFDVEAFVEALASDDLEGREQLTSGSEAAQELIIGEVSRYAEPAFPDAAGDEGYLSPYDGGTNVLAVIPGDELADEYVLIGAHYDHHGLVGGSCAGDPEDPDDEVCNGATDNATGVAAAIDVGRSIAADGPPRRSVVLAFWDGEEDGLIGSGMYVADPLVPLDRTIAYVNLDIQGSNLLPSLATYTIMVGAETGGPDLVAAADEATNASSLDTVALSLLFGQGRSDHAVLVAAGVPSVFFTDANSGCYHTVEDDIDAVDFAKLDQQINTAEALSRDLVATDTPPVFDAAAPPSTYDDAAELLTIVEAAQVDLDLVDAEQRATAEQFLVDLQAVVDAGPQAFDDAANAVLLGGAVEVVSALTEVDCDAFLPEEPAGE